MKWEYRVEPLDSLKDLSIVQDKFNEFGAEGWELVAVVPRATGYGETWTAAIFKRLKSN